MKVGLIARGEDRGLGIQTWEWWRHMRPERTLIVDPGDLARGFPLHLDRYGVHPRQPAAGTVVACWDGHEFSDEAMVRRWLDGLDVIYTAETFYDHRLPRWCAEAGVRLVVHVNPEFFRWTAAHLPAVRWWLPTSWRADRLPRDAEVVPVPVPLDRWPEPAPRHHGVPTFLHVAGHRAAGDRNGTGLVMAALARTSAKMRVVIATQDERLPVVRHGRNVELIRATGGTANYWDLYEGDVLVMPRRYGGLCLPANEAAAAGLALVMTDTPPNHEWPALPISVSSRQPMGTPGGTVVSATADASHLARLLDRLASDRELRHHQQHAARAWAEARSWSALAPRITLALEAACS